MGKSLCAKKLKYFLLIFYEKFATYLQYVIIIAKGLHLETDKNKNMKKLTTLDLIALILTIIGALNWGLVGFFNFDLVAAIFGDMTIMARIIYSLVGVSAIYLVFISASLAKK